MTRNEVLSRLIQKFTSGNSLQVQRAHVTREEFNAIFVALRDAGAAEARLARVEALADGYDEFLADEFNSGRSSPVTKAYETVLEELRAALKPAPDAAGGG